MRLVTMLAVLLLVGCISPGKETKEALTDSQKFGWDDQGRFTADALGTHAHRFTMAQGVLVFDAEGKLDLVNSQVEYYLEADPSAQAAATTAGTMAQVLAMQTQQVTALVENMTSIVAAVVPGIVNPAPAPKPVEPD